MWFGAHNRGYNSVQGDGAFISSGVLTVHRAVGGFGSKATAAPLYWNDFEGQNIGDSYLACGMANLGNDGIATVQVANDRAFSGTKSLKCIYPVNASTNASAFPRVGNNVPNSQSIYIFCKEYWAMTVGSVQNAFIFKHARAGGGAAYTGSPHVYQTIRPNASGIDTGGDSGYVTATTGTSYSQETFGTVISPLNANVWNTDEYAYKLGTVGATNGVYQVIINGKDNVGGKVYDGSGVLLTGSAGYCNNNDNVSNAITWAISIFDGLDQYGIGNQCSVWMDCSYVDTTLQRCVMTDNAVYASSTKFMVQIPTAWTDTNAVFTYRNDGFVAGATGWIHMFNANGVEVIAYPVTVQ